PGKGCGGAVVNALVDPAGEIAVARDHWRQVIGAAGVLIGLPAHPAKLARPVAVILHIDAPVRQALRVVSEGIGGAVIWLDLLSRVLWRIEFFAVRIQVADLDADRVDAL